MAQQGFFRDPPNRRMAYDEDGTIVVQVEPDGTIGEYNLSTRRILNGEAHVITDTYGQADYDLGGGGPYYTMIFPELRDVSHTYRNLMGGTYVGTSFSGNLQMSTNTTNGSDGDWENVSIIAGISESTTPNFRGDRLLAVGAAGAKGIRHKGPASGTYTDWNFCQWHVYGVKTAGQTPHRIDFTDSLGNELLIDFDYGDQPRSSDRIWGPSETWNQSSAVYLRNRSGTKQATDVVVTYETMTSDFDNFLSISKDNITYGTQVTYATINPTQIVGPIYVKHSPSISSTLGVKAARLQVQVGTWL